MSALSRDTEHANDSISAIFDKEKEQKRLQTAQLAGEISGQMTNIVTTMGDIRGLEKAQSAKNAGTLPAGATEKQRGEWLEKMRDSPEYQAEMKQWGIGSTSQKVAQTVGSILTGLVTGNAGQAVAGGLNPWAAQLIKKETTDASGNVDVATNAMAHAVWGAVSSQMSGGSVAAGAAGAFSGELATRYIAEKYWGADTPEKIAALGQEDREQLSLLGTLAAGLAGGMAGNSSAAATSGAVAGKNAVENNSLADIAQAQSEGKTLEQKADEQVEAENERYKKANCGVMSAEACSVKMYQERREALKDMASAGAEFGSDFIPVYGDIKSFAEAQSAFDYLVAAMGIIPGAGDAAGKVIKAAETALKKGDVTEASKLINKASDEISAYSSATYPKLKNDLFQQNLNNIAKQDPRLAAVVKGDNEKLNYGVGTGTKEEADQLGKIWVGEGARPTSDGSGLVSADGTRIYRSPKGKPNAPDSLNPTGTQANFESYTKNIETGKMEKTGNGHLNISGENK
ncbi:VENN motif pre-toxin domain-containing protein [Pantoea vagans]|uniref:VENN motif pre-toxin domain-containing protein n=1 Tax=Pantoea vagans TaxID=470934 RepID=UPI0023B1D0D4|nr:VENN motif pre-toxin domain-containing protein [Pantoea vagans]MDE8559409.1 VENN motif pre-toxin domain-containing protein [Pantoea vagans]MDE8579412.1 VENN motif pre-toxin domain-containing protein [Pantoea vagans]